MHLNLKFFGFMTIYLSIYIIILFQVNLFMQVSHNNLITHVALVKGLEPWYRQGSRKYARVPELIMPLNTWILIVVIFIYDSICHLWLLI